MLGKKKMVRQVIIYFILFLYILYKTPSAGEDNRCEGEEGESCSGEQGLIALVLQFASVTSFIAPCLN